MNSVLMSHDRKRQVRARFLLAALALLSGYAASACYASVSVPRQHASDDEHVTPPLVNVLDAVETGSDTDPDAFAPEDEIRVIELSVEDRPDGQGPVRVASQYLRPQATAGNELFQLFQRQLRTDSGVVLLQYPEAAATHLVRREPSLRPVSLARPYDPTEALLEAVVRTAASRPVRESLSTARTFEQHAEVAAGKTLRQFHPTAQRRRHQAAITGAHRRQHRLATLNASRQVPHRGVRGVSPSKTRAQRESSRTSEPTTTHPDTIRPYPGSFQWIWGGRWEPWLQLRGPPARTAP